jgi:protein-disulfide isomerase
MKRKTLFIVASVVLLLGFWVGAAVYKSGKNDPSAQRAERNRTPFVRMHSPTLGNADAEVQLVEFLDPACATCASFYPLVKQILAANPDQIQLVLRYATFHKGSDAVVAVLEAAGRQGQFWPALEALLASQADWAPHHTAQVDRVWRHLAGLGLDFEQVRADMASPEIARAVAQDVADAKALNVRKTPSFFVNGQPLTRFGYEPLKALVDEALSSAQH